MCPHSLSTGHAMQHQVNKAFTPDYNAVVDPMDERWLSQIRTKLLNHSYISSGQMLDDIGLIVKNAKRYHLNKSSQDRNLGGGSVTLCP